MNAHRPVHTLSEGDVVFAKQSLKNDGSLPEYPSNATVVEANTRGVLVKIGHLEETPSTLVYLVRFERLDGQLGPPVGCWEEELIAEKGGES